MAKPNGWGNSLAPNNHLQVSGGGKADGLCRGWIYRLKSAYQRRHLVRVTTTLAETQSCEEDSEGGCQEGLVTGKMDTGSNANNVRREQQDKNGTTQYVICTCLGRTREVWRLNLLRIEDWILTLYCKERVHLPRTERCLACLRGRGLRPLFQVVEIRDPFWR